MYMFINIIKNILSINSKGETIMESKINTIKNLLELYYIVHSVSMHLINIHKFKLESKLLNISHFIFNEYYRILTSI